MSPVRMKLINWSDPPAPRYEPPLYYGQDMNAETLRQKRAEYARERDAMLAMQKQQRDRDAARFFKDEAQHLLKLYRAADFWFKWATGAPGWRPSSEWPCELADELDHLHSVATIHP